MPTIEISYQEKVGETVWQVEFNEEVVLEKTDHSGHSTIMLLDRNKLEALKHRHINRLIIHAEFPDEVHLSSEGSFFNILESPGS